jgi:hypothetical protein
VFIHLPLAELHPATAEVREEVFELKPRPGREPPRLYVLDDYQLAAGEKVD